MAKAPSTSRTSKTSTTRRASAGTRKTTTTSRSASPKATVTGKTVLADKPTGVVAKDSPRKVPSDVVVAPNSAETALPEMRKRELIDAVVDRCGIKKRYAKPSIEAALAILGEALEEGRSLRLPPMGRVKVQRSKELEDGHVIVVKVRRKNQDEDEGGDKSPETPLAMGAD